MKLDRNVDGRGKYAVVLMRKLGPARPDAQAAVNALASGGFVEFGSHGNEDEFFVVKLKDAYAQAALMAYADAAQDDDPEYAEEVRALARRAGPSSPYCKRPD